MDLIVQIKEIKGYCPIYNVGDGFRIEKGYRLNTDQPICMHSLASILPFYNALRVADPNNFGLSGKIERKKAYVQCPDPASHTGGGTVIFEISRIGSD